MMGFINNVAQVIIMTRGCVANKTHVASSKFKVIDYTQTLLIGYNKSLLYPVLSCMVGFQNNMARHLLYVRIMLLA